MERKDIITLAAILGSLVILSPVIQAIMQPDVLSESSHTVEIIIDSSVLEHYNGTLEIIWYEGNQTIELTRMAGDHTHSYSIHPFVKLTQAIQYTLTYTPTGYPALGPYTLNSMMSYTFHDSTGTLTITCNPTQA